MVRYACNSQSLTSATGRGRVGVTMQYGGAIYEHRALDTGRFSLMNPSLWLILIKFIDMIAGVKK